MSFLKKIKLTNKKVYILGGFGLIGSKVVENILSVGGKIVILDIKKNAIKKGVRYVKFNCSKLNNLESNFNKIIKKLGCPDIFINCSYPRTKDWNKSSFNKITLKIMEENISIHLNSHAWLSKMVAENMCKKKRRCV